MEWFVLTLASSYTLGEGYMKFFKNKLEDLKKRHESIKEEIKN